jgi:hypothetical protein
MGGIRVTEGIIQKVFNKYTAKHEVIPFAVSLVDVNDVIKKLQQELIAEINSYSFDTDKYFDDTIKEALIGDNQE